MTDSTTGEALGKALFICWLLSVLLLDTVSAFRRRQRHDAFSQVQRSRGRALLRGLAEIGFGLAGVAGAGLLLLLVSSVSHPLFDAPGVDAAGRWVGRMHHGVLAGGFAALGALQIVLMRWTFDRWALPHRDPSPSPAVADRPWLLELSAALTWVVSLLSSGLLVYGLVYLERTATARRLLDGWGINLGWSVTCFELLQVGMVAAATGMALDALAVRRAHLTARRVGVLVLAFSVAGGWIASHTPEAVATTAFEDPIVAELAALQQLEERLDALPDGHRAIVVAAAGGGSRAAVFAGMTYSVLQQPWSRLAAFSSTAEPAEGACLRPFDDVVLISSVSGGSVASAHAVARLAWSSDIPAPECADGTPEGTLRDLLRVAPLVVDLRRDFYAPALLGVFAPGHSRAAMLRDWWATWFRWSDAWDHFSAARAAARREGRPPPSTAPMLLLNATSAHSGRRVPVTFPPLDDAWWSGAAEVDLDERTLAPPTEAVRYVEDAVRMSASFPFGMSMASLAPLDDPPLRPVTHPVEPPPRLITDGGVLDNTGLDVIPSFFAGLAARADGDCAGELACAAKATAGAVRDALCEHGVLVLEIDSGAKPGRSGKVRMPVLDSVVAYESLGQAARVKERTTAQAARTGASASLRCDAFVGARQPSDSARVVYRADTERGEAPVPTAWALGARDIAQLEGKIVESFGSGATPVVEKLMYRAPPPAVAPVPVAPGHDPEPTLRALFGGGTAPTGATGLDPALGARWGALQAFVEANPEPGVYLVNDRAAAPPPDAWMVVRPDLADVGAAGLKLRQSTLLVAGDTPDAPILGVVVAGTELPADALTAVQAGVVPLSDLPRYLKAPRCAGLRVDVFACEGVAGAWARAEAVTAALASDWDRGDRLGLGAQAACLRTRVLTRGQNADPRYGVAGDEIRFDPAPPKGVPTTDEVWVAAVLQELAGPHTAFDLHPLPASPQTTPDYVSVFVCRPLTPR